LNESIASATGSDGQDVPDLTAFPEVTDAIKTCASEIVFVIRRA